MSFLKFIFYLILGAALFVKINAQGDSFENLLRSNTFPIRVEGGKLSGTGADLLAASLADVQFVALGEEHNKRAVHEFGGALFRLLHERYDFNHLALEEDPFWCKMLSETAKNSGSSGAVVDLRPLFDAARTSKEMNPELRRMIMSDDVFLFLSDNETGSIKRLQTPNYRWYTN